MQMRLRFEHVVGQKYATDAIYSHLQRHIEAYEFSRLQRSGGAGSGNSAGDAYLSPNKPLVLSFHGPTGTGKSFTANSIASALFFNSHSAHVHTYHGSDFSDDQPEHVADSIRFLKHEFISHVRRCPLALFIIEEIHLMAPGVLDGLRHLMDAQPPNSRLRITKPVDAHAHAGATANAASSEVSPTDSPMSGAVKSSSTHSTAISLDFSHVIWLFTTNIGSSQVQQQAYAAAKNGLPRESLSPSKLHDMLFASLEHADQLRLLRDGSVLSALIPFFPLFKSHVKECATVQLNLRKKSWLSAGQLASFDWDSSVPSYAAGQVKYSGPISQYGCKNINELLSVMLSPLTREFRRLQEEADHQLSETIGDARVTKREKVWAYSLNLFAKAKRIFTGRTWNFGNTNVTMAVEQNNGDTNAGALSNSNSGVSASAGVKAEIVFVLASVSTGGGGDSAAGSAEVERREIRRPLHEIALSIPLTQQNHQNEEDATPQDDADSEANAETAGTAKRDEL